MSCLGLHHVDKLEEGALGGYVGHIACDREKDGQKRERDRKVLNCWTTSSSSSQGAKDKTELVLDLAEKGSQAEKPGLGSETQS